MHSALPPSPCSTERHPPLPVRGTQWHQEKIIALSVLSRTRIQGDHGTRWRSRNETPPSTGLRCCRIARASAGARLCSSGCSFSAGQRRRLRDDSACGPPAGSPPADHRRPWRPGLSALVKTARAMSVSTYSRAPVFILAGLRRQNFRHSCLGQAHPLPNSRQEDEWIVANSQTVTTPLRPGAHAWRRAAERRSDPVAPC